VERRDAMVRKLAAALAASLLAAGAALAQPAGEQPATAPEVVYRIVQGGIEIGEAGLVLERDAAGITTSSRAELHGLVDVTAALRTGPDGAAESYGLEGTMRGVSVDLTPRSTRAASASRSCRRAGSRLWRSRRTSPSTCSTTCSSMATRSWPSPPSSAGSRSRSPRSCPRSRRWAAPA